MKATLFAYSSQSTRSGIYRRLPIGLARLLDSVRFLLWFTILVGWLPSQALAGLRLEMCRSEASMDLLCLPRSIPNGTNPAGMGILPDYVVQRSVDFKNWVTVLRWQGGFGLPVSQAKLSTISFGQSRMAFYRIKEHVNLPAANLRQFCLANANLSEADFSGANMMGIDLSRACLRGANLQQTQMNQANLSGADLCQADLFGATVQGANLNGAILLNTRMPDGGIETDNADAEQLALEISGQLLAPVDLYVQIRADLAAVRTAFPAVASVRCFPRWGIGQVIVNSPEDRIERLKDGDLGGFTVERISPSSSFNLLKFERHYHPKVLSSLLWAEYRIWGEPNYVYGDGGRITWDPTTGQYTFSVAWGDCLAGCTCGHFWTFLVSADKQVVLIEEFGSPLPPVP